VIYNTSMCDNFEKVASPSYLDVDGYIINENSKGPKVQTLGSKGPKGPKFKMATKVNKTTSAIAETNYFQNSHSMFIKPTVFLV